jgi:GDP-4-dehydro-6-deoxy-D-mannose reductase
MRVLVSGSTGFVGGWLAPELEQAGHVVHGMPLPDELDIADAPAVRALVATVRPDAVVHLAGMAYAPDASADAAEALRVNVGGTLAMLEACRREVPGIAVLVVGSAEVYGAPEGNAPLTEASPLAPRGVYGLTKLAGEALAIATGSTGALRVVVARSFNHTGPGQRQVFAVPAFAGRVLDARRAGVHEIRAGNVDLLRDIGDVRDVVCAYRLLLEALAEGRIPGDRRVYNVASGRSVTMRSIIEQLGRIAGWSVTITRDPALVRTDDPPVIRGDASALRQVTGWEPRIALEQTLADLLASLDRGGPSA